MLVKCKDYAIAVIPQHSSSSSSLAVGTAASNTSHIGGDNVFDLLIIPSSHFMSIQERWFLFTAFKIVK